MEKLNSLSFNEKSIFSKIFFTENIINYSGTKLKDFLIELKRSLDFDENKVILFLDNFRGVPINHNDLHPRNILKDNNNNFKLIDFDYSNIKGETK